MTQMLLPSEQIGSIPRNRVLIEAYQTFKSGLIDYEQLNLLAQKETEIVINELTSLGCPVISDGEQRKFDGFAHYCLHNSCAYHQHGLLVDFSDGHKRLFAPHLKTPPFKYEHTADEFLAFAVSKTKLPVKQAVISPSMLSLVYPPAGIDGYNHHQFVNDLIEQHVGEVRRCLELGAYKVQIDFTEARLSLKFDPSGNLLRSFVSLINKCLAHFNVEERQKIGIHTCPGADIDATHSADIEYKYLLPTLFEIQAGNFYVALKGEKDKEKTLQLLGTIIKPYQKVFVGVINPISNEVESPEEIRDLLLLAAKYIPLDQLGSTDDCGFSPFADDVSTARDIAYAKIKARLEGTRLASEILFPRNNVVASNE
ncbi:uroporphyrinogen decarboxylase/cobalamine-independent methonine synthase family protein [Pseudoalteromonas xiamenensis]|uniref:5-methyltetrahydropteroyltriglutamate-- homocysteine methyltransferase n=1 Tax=Pseudoalteromonas xiamenensis TaxID=882626 RepID=UPI0027E3FCFB|nr:5-methyltetrahydropteroyltriglutamate--homocysteine methyltransferase [Pseudoalteromonas xiamenensis]WMN60011.1 5-methyltetrahydropteroyltriglutamate--homocysteine methyltransferase [Pseudoalteromonas xiamenensis]